MLQTNRFILLKYHLKRRVAHNIVPTDLNVCRKLPTFPIFQIFNYNCRKLNSNE